MTTIQIKEALIEGAENVLATGQPFWHPTVLPDDVDFRATEAFQDPAAEDDEDTEANCLFLLFVAEAISE